MPVNISLGNFLIASVKFISTIVKHNKPSHAGTGVPGIFGIRMRIVSILLFLGVNLPHYAHEERQNRLIEHFHNTFNNSVSAEKKGEANLETDTGFLGKLAKFLDEVLEPHRYRIYNPGVVRLLHIIKQYLERPFVQYFEFPLLNFVRLIEGPFWEECAEKLRTKFCVDIYIDFNSEVIDAGNIGIYLGGPSVYELKSAKSNLATYMDKTVNPPKEKENDINDSKSTDRSEPADTDDQKTEQLCEISEEEKVSENNKQIENYLKMEDEKTAPSNNDSSTKEATEFMIIDKVRDSTSVDRSLESGERTDKDDKQTFTRSKSVPASSTTESHDLPNQGAKRAKYDSECSNENILQPSPMQELTLFKENLNLVLMNRPEDNMS